MKRFTPHVLETDLLQSLTRLDRLIGDAECLASRSRDDETLEQLKHELTRLHESRLEISERLHRTTVFNRIARWMLTGFVIGYALLVFTSIVATLLGGFEPILAPFVVLSLLLLIPSAFGYFVALIIRDAVVLGQRPWRFSLRSLLVITTVIAVVLGLLVSVFKK